MIMVVVVVVMYNTKISQNTFGNFGDGTWRQKKLYSPIVV
jgi:hypothetical protein